MREPPALQPESGDDEPLSKLQRANLQPPSSPVSPPFEMEVPTTSSAGFVIKGITDFCFYFRF